MASLMVEGDRLFLRLRPLERLESFHGDIAVPLSAVRSVRVTEDVWAELRGIRAPGTGLPGVIAVGTRRGSFGKDFAVVHGRGRGVVVETDDFPFCRLIVTVPDPDAVAAEVSAALR
jgi:hypothetical protein